MSKACESWGAFFYGQIGLGAIAELSGSIIVKTIQNDEKCKYTEIHKQQITQWNTRMLSGTWRIALGIVGLVIVIGKDFAGPKRHMQGIQAETWVGDARESQ